MKSRMAHSLVGVYRSASVFFFPFSATRVRVYLSSFLFCQGLPQLQSRRRTGR
ncbi:YPR064W-like protein [Saccharomyces kudriavzevii IFO 1802]|uniref:YPR064W-like protein n=1 Tax=Saccharomyces kudriavzevii (strain ATCC MYA-4449 / AS 2.2408 / CBS 8840 / NBRC 1802 / NCYC 2889) TaxID=226230 RepID=J5PBF2_SACK1|nr:YPR064W-like protein [Saccharomyces kudriavzevii IFO 1802]